MPTFHGTYMPWVFSFFSHRMRKSKLSGNYVSFVCILNACWARERDIQWAPQTAASFLFLHLQQNKGHVRILIWRHRKVGETHLEDKGITTASGLCSTWGAVLFVAAFLTLGWERFTASIWKDLRMKSWRIKSRTGRLINCLISWPLPKWISFFKACWQGLLY